MYRHAALLLLATASLFAAEDEPIVFKSDVALVRVDAQVLDRSNRAITGLRPEDFVVYEQGQQQQIRNFARENLPVDVLFLVDVSGSMQPHVQRLANAAHQALGVMAEGDRVGIMVFDRSTRIRLRFTQNPVSSAYQFDRILQEEGFNGGTDITRGLLDAASYIGREGRKDARKAIVILTDDQTERDRDDARVESALTRADAVLMALIAPDAMMSHRGGYPGGGGGYPGGGYPQGGGRYPRRGGIGGGLGGIILGGPMGGGWPGGGGGYPRGGGYPGGYPGGGGVQIGGHTKSAGTSEIARQSGGDSSSIDDSNALQDTLERIRNRYALYFYLPQGAKAGTERSIEVALSASARQRYQGADVRYRQRYLAPGAGGAPDTIDAEPVVVSQSPDSGNPRTTTDDPEAGTGLHRRRRPAVDDSSGSRGPNAGGWPAASSSDRESNGGSVLAPAPAGNGGSSAPEPQSQDQGGWKRSGDSNPAPAPSTSPSPTPQQPQAEPEQKGGWRRVKPGEQP